MRKSLMTILSVTLLSTASMAAYAAKDIGFGTLKGIKIYLITTQRKHTLRSLSGIGGVLTATKASRGII